MNRYFKWKFTNMKKNEESQSTRYRHNPNLTYLSYLYINGEFIKLYTYIVVLYRKNLILEKVNFYLLQCNHNFNWFIFEDKFGIHHFLSNIPILQTKVNVLNFQIKKLL